MKNVRCIAVLAHGEADTLDLATRQRIDAAVNRVFEIHEEGKVLPVLVFMAGVGRNDSMFTLATHMLLYARSFLKKYPEVEVQVIYNFSEYSIWGTILEMAWARKKVYEEYPDAAIEYVTNSYHALRARFINRVFYGESCKMVTSNDVPPPLWHEVFAYLKVVAYLMRMHKPLEVVRRKFYSGG